MLRIVIALGLVAGSALADAPQRIDVEVDATVEVDAGFAVGFRCDDIKLISASMITRNDRNVFVVKGVAAGKTQCRVGTDVQRPSTLYDVVVTEKPAKPKRRP